MDNPLNNLMACPLDRVWVPGHYGAPLTAEKPGIRLERTTPVALIQLSLFPRQEKKALTILKKAGIKAFPETGHSTIDTKLSIYSLGAGRYLVEGTTTDLHAKLIKSLSPEICSITDLSSARTVLTVTGPDVATVLATGIAIDFHQQSFPIGKVMQTSVHHMPVMVVRQADNQFRLFALGSYAVSTLQWLETACDAHGFERV